MRDEPADVLLVEDNPGDVRLTREAFREGPVDVTLHVATDGVDAAEFLRRRGEYADAPRPDLVLLDLNLPRMDGHALLSEIRDDPELASLPVVVLTSSKAPDDLRRSYDLRANAYLTKPIDPAAFTETMRSVQEFWLSAVVLPAHVDS